MSAGPEKSKHGEMGVVEGGRHIKDKQGSSGSGQATNHVCLELYLSFCLFAFFLFLCLHEFFFFLFETQGNLLVEWIIFGISTNFDTSKRYTGSISLL